MESGDKVRYKAAFLRSIGAYTGAMPHARGVVRTITKLGPITLADVEWNDPDVPSRVNINNLERCK